MSTTLTDAQVVKGAWKLINKTSDGQELPPGHSLADAWHQAKTLQTVGLKYLEKYGDRLQKLDPMLHTALKSWEDIAL